MTRWIRAAALGAGLSAALLALAACGSGSGSVNVYFGYADTGDKTAHQLPAHFPNPWKGGANVDFVGAGSQVDAGAIRIENTTGSDVTVQSASVDIDQQHFALWGSNLKVPADGSLILTQTRITQANPLQTNFDTSELVGKSCSPSTPGGVPVLHLVIDGRRADVQDKDKILNTGGRDVGVCPGTPNESHGWDSAGAVNLQGTSENVGDPGLLGLTAGIIALLAFLPTLLGALLLLLIGWLLARFLGRLVAALFDRIGLGPAVERTGLFGFLGARRPSGRTGAAWLIGVLVAWFIFLFFLISAAGALHLTAVTVLLTKVGLWLPKLITALVILFIGALLARVMGTIARGAAAQSGVGDPDLLAGGARIAVLAFAFIVAIDHTGIAAPFIEALFGAVVFAIALALGLAFGLGGRGTAAEILQRWYADAQNSGNRLE